ncbi:MAG: hypothetical protein CML06_12420 [Pseudomonadales bacterium]|nr:hypothetical protein [Pseudomonadales bacterium]
MAGQSPVFLVCAAGSSTRFGSNNLLHPLAGQQSLLATTLSRLRAGSDLPCQVAYTGTRTQLREEILRCNCTPLPLRPASAGLGDTIARAVQQNADAGGWIICLADMPAIQPQTYATIGSHCYREQIVAPVYQGRRGHPVFFPRSCFSRLSQLHGDQGAAALLRQNPDSLCLVEVADAGVLLDMDTPDDLDRLTGIQ